MMQPGGCLDSFSGVGVSGFLDSVLSLAWGLLVVS